MGIIPETTYLDEEQLIDLSEMWNNNSYND